MKALRPSPVRAASCEHYGHKPSAFTDGHGRPDAGVCECGRYVWLPADRVELAARAKAGR